MWAHEFSSYANQEDRARVCGKTLKWIVKTIQFDMFCARSYSYHFNIITLVYDDNKGDERIYVQRAHIIENITHRKSQNWRRWWWQQMFMVFSLEKVFFLQHWALPFTIFISVSHLSLTFSAHSDSINDAINDRNPFWKIDCFDVFSVVILSFYRFYFYRKNEQLSLYCGRLQMIKIVCNLSTKYKITSIFNYNCL